MPNIDKVQVKGVTYDFADTEARENVTSLKGALSFDEYLINTGEYTIKSADIESGQWSYSSKTATTTRARTKMLLPVRKGMGISYSNTTYDTFFGVLETPSSSSYKQTIGWKTDGNGFVLITEDGYLTFVIRNHSNTSATVNPADYNSTVTIKTEQKRFDESLDKLHLVPGVDLLIPGDRINTVNRGVTFTWNADKTECTVNGTSDGTGTAGNYFLGSATSIPNGITPGKKYHVKVKTTDKKAGLSISWYTGSGTYTGTYRFTEDGTLMVPANTTGIYFRIDVPNNQSVTNAVVSNLAMIEIEAVDISTAEKIAEQVETNENAGINPSIKLRWLNSTATTYGYGINLFTAGRTSCVPFLVRPGGAYVYYDESIKTDVKTSYRINFYHLVDGVYEKANDYEYMMAENPITIPTYIHYAENLYVSITYYMNEYDGTLHVSCGEIKNGAFSNLPFLFPVHTKVISGDEVSIDIGSYDPRYFYSYARNYGCILPLKNVNRIIAAPKYALIAQVYKVDANEQTVTVLNSLYSSTIPDNSEFVEGLPIIDLSEYDEEGYVIIGVQSAYYYKENTRYNDAMGQLKQYDDAIKNIAIEWKENTVVEHDGSIPAKAKINIDTMKKYGADTYGFSYGSWISSQRDYFPAMKDSNFMFYNGGNYYNCPFRNVSLESLNAAAKNPNSRLYKYWTAQSPDSNVYGYGATCGPMAGLIAGFTGAISPAGLYYDMYQREGVTVRDINTIEDIKTGDFIVRLNTDSFEYGHIVYVTDVVRINNVVYAVIGIEAYPPFLRYRAFVNYDAFPFSVDTGLFSFYSSREIGTQYGSSDKYLKAGRLEYTKYKTFREAYGYIDDVTPVDTGVMCDRGSGSVYCINQLCEISISTDITDTITVYNGDTAVGTITPGSIGTTENGYKVTDITSMLTAAGEYTLKIGGETVEHFMVAQAETALCKSISGDNDHVKIEFSQNGATAIGIAGYYYAESVGHTYMASFNLSAEEQEQGYCIIPKVLGEGFPFDYFNVLYRVANGTFQILCYKWGSRIIDEPSPTIKQSSSYVGVTVT